MKPVEVENVGVMTISVKSLPGQQNVENGLSQLKMQFSHILLLHFFSSFITIKK